MSAVYRGLTPRGYSGKKRIGIRSIRYDDQLEGFAAQIEDERPERVRLAAKHLGLKRIYPVITLIESIVHDWLERRNLPFIYQATSNVGSTPDFLIIPTAVVVLVQGQFFHTQPGARAEDVREVQAILGANVEGIQVRSAVRIWEDDVLSQYRELYFDAMLRGDEIRSVYNTR
jgi:hypothetical protein